MPAFAQKLACFAVDEVQSRARETADPFILVLGNVLIIVQPMLDVEFGCRASEDKCRHLVLPDDESVHNLAQALEKVPLYKLLTKSF